MRGLYCAGVVVGRGCGVWGCGVRGLWFVGYVECEGHGVWGLAGCETCRLWGL